MATVYNTSIVRDGLVLHVDAGNPKSYSANVQPYSTDMYEWVKSAGTNSAATLTRDDSTQRSPANGIPVKMTITGNDPFMSTYNNSIYNLAPAASGQTWTVSVWAKSSVPTDGQLYIFGATAAGTVFYLDGVSQTDLGGGIISITPTWQRFSYSFTFSNALVARIQCRLDGTNTGGSGIDIWWDGLQVERSSSVTPFNPLVNANRSSWYDLTGGAACVMNLNTVYTYDSAGYIIFDGSAQNFAKDNNGTRTQFNYGSYSISTLVYPTSLTSTDNASYVRICEKQGYPNAYFIFQINSTGAITFQAGDNSVTQQYVSPISATGVISTNNWYYCVAVVDRTSAVSKIYVNGSEVASAAVGSSFASMNSSGVLLFTSGYAEMAGRYSVFSVYNIALTAAQVKQNYEALRKRYNF